MPFRVVLANTFCSCLKHRATSPQHFCKTMPDTVTISNGQEFYVIPRSDLDAARSDGFYVPSERQMTIVSNGDELFEIPINDAPDAEADGFQDLLSAERSGLKSGQPLTFEHTGIRELIGGYVTIATGVEEEGSISPDNLTIDTGEEEEEVGDVDVDVDSVEQEAELLQQERELLLEEATGFQKFWLQVKFAMPEEEEQKRLFKIYGVTIILHLFVAIVFGIYKLAAPNADEVIPIISTQSIGAKETEIIEPDEVIVDEVESSSDSTMTPNLEINSVAKTNFSSAVGALSGGSGKQGFGTSIDGLGSGKGVSTSFFGSKAVASTFVFVVDNSLSMTQGRFETACSELFKTVNQMKPKQSFYVVFFSDTAYPLYYPNTVRKLQPATPANKQKLAAWLNTVPLCLKTNGKEAMNLAFSLKPEVIYILGDGAFTDNTASLLISHKQPIPINTLGMQVTGSAEEQFKLIAEFNGGTYNDVGVDPRMAELAKRMPRARYRTRSGVWGLKL